MPIFPRFANEFLTQERGFRNAHESAREMKWQVQNTKKLMRSIVEEWDTIKFRTASRQKFAALNPKTRVANAIVKYINSKEKKSGDHADRVSGYDAKSSSQVWPMSEFYSSGTRRLLE
ncbi:MAG: hypothetical protein U1E19_00680 [Rhodoblastus sp.]